MTRDIATLAKRISRYTDLSSELIFSGDSGSDLYKTASILLNNASCYFVDYVAYNNVANYDDAVKHVELVADLLRKNNVINV